MRGAGAGQRGSLVPVPICPGSGRVFVHTMTARSPRSPGSPAAASAPRCIALHFFAKFASARVWASASSQPAWLAQPTHNICVLFHPNLNLKIVLSCCTRVNCAPNMSVLSVLSVVSLGCQDRERRERRGVRPHWLRWSAVS